MTKEGEWDIRSPHSAHTVFRSLTLALSSSPSPSYGMGESRIFWISSREMEHSLVSFIVCVCVCVCVCCVLSAWLSVWLRKTTSRFDMLVCCSWFWPRCDDSHSDRWTGRQNAPLKHTMLQSVTIVTRLPFDGVCARWHLGRAVKALASGANVFVLVGSNPTDVTRVHFCTYHDSTLHFSFL